MLETRVLAMNEKARKIPVRKHSVRALASIWTLHVRYLTPNDLRHISDTKAFPSM